MKIDACGARALFARRARATPIHPRCLVEPRRSGIDFPFCFITIACGAISGFHSLISSGTTPKLLAREGHARPVGYGAMALESYVGAMALVVAEQSVFVDGGWQGK